MCGQVVGASQEVRCSALACLMWGVAVRDGLYDAPDCDVWTIVGALVARHRLLVVRHGPQTVQITAIEFLM